MLLWISSLPGDGCPSFHLIVNSKASAGCLVRMTLLATSTLLIIDSVSCAPAIFNRLSNAVVRMMVQCGLHSIVSYLDDSLSLAKQKLNVSKVSWLLLDCFIHLDLMSIGKKLSLHVNVLLSQGSNFTPQLSLCLPSDKLDRLNSLIASFSAKSSTSKHQPQSLEGSLNFVCHVVYGSRTFLRRIGLFTV